MAIKFRIFWGKYIKRVTSMLIGPSPELELALFTLCFRARPDEVCKVSFDRKTFKIWTGISNSSRGQTNPKLALENAYFIL